MKSKNNKTRLKLSKQTVSNLTAITNRNMNVVRGGTLLTLTTCTLTTLPKPPPPEDESSENCLSYVFRSECGSFCGGMIC